MKGWTEMGQNLVNYEILVVTVNHQSVAGVDWIRFTGNL